MATPESPSHQLIIKHTFLELTSESDGCCARKHHRRYSDSALLEGMQDESDFPPSPHHPRLRVQAPLETHKMPPTSSRIEEWRVVDLEDEFCGIDHAFSDTDTDSGSPVSAPRQGNSYMSTNTTNMPSDTEEVERTAPNKIAPKIFESKLRQGFSGPSLATMRSPGPVGVDGGIRTSGTSTPPACIRALWGSASPVGAQPRPPPPPTTPTEGATQRTFQESQIHDTDHSHGTWTSCLTWDGHVTNETLPLGFNTSPLNAGMTNAGIPWTAGCTPTELISQVATGPSTDFRAYRHHSPQLRPEAPPWAAWDTPAPCHGFDKSAHSVWGSVDSTHFPPHMPEIRDARRDFALFGQGDAVLQGLPWESVPCQSHHVACDWASRHPQAQIQSRRSDWRLNRQPCAVQGPDAAAFSPSVAWEDADWSTEPGRAPGFVPWTQSQNHAYEVSSPPPWSAWDESDSRSDGTGRRSHATRSSNGDTSQIPKAEASSTGCRSSGSLAQRRSGPDTSQPVGNPSPSSQLKKQENQERWSEQLVEPKLAVSKKAAASRSSRDIESCATGTAHIRKDAHEGRGRRDPQTTVMLRNMPNNYSRDMLLSMMDAEGLAGTYNFVYLPMDFKSGANLGYAFVNLVSAAVVDMFWKTLNGFSRWTLPSYKVCEVSWSGPYQGLAAHIRRYRNSPLMHEDVPDEYKPVVLLDGIRAEFPPPTKRLRAPPSNHGSQHGGRREHKCNEANFQV